MDREQESKKPIKVATGIEVRQWNKSSSIRVIFWYKGIECRETLKLEPTKNNIKYAERLRGEILNAIALGTFNYADYFPQSKRARLFGHVWIKATVGELLQDYMSIAAKTLEPSTVNGYQKVCDKHLFPVFGHIPLRELSPIIIRNWVIGLTITAKTVRNILTPLRNMLDQALNDGLIERHPLNKLVLSKLLNKKTIKSDWEVDPFDQDEIKAILNEADGQARNLFQFAFFTGLRTSELIALEWNDIDWFKGVVRISRAVVLKQEKGTKTKAGTRDILLLPPAAEALKAQKQAQQKAKTEQAINTPTKAKVDHELDSLIQKIGELMANGQHKEAEPLLRQAQQYAKNHKLFDARLGGFIEEMQKMRDWAGFAIIPKKQDLLRQMQHLAQQATEANLDALNHLDKIKALQAEWQGLGIANNEQEKNLWQQFKEVSQQAYAPCQQFFDQQNAIQAENATQRQALCQELKHYLDNLPEQVNWQGHIAILKKAREDWQKYHPVEAKKHKQLQSRFTRIIKALEDKLHAEYQLQEDKKRGLIAKAENLLNHENIFEACHQAKDLQNTWKTLGSCGHNKDQQLWEEFRQHCDALFAKRHEAKAAKQAEDAQVVAQAEELLKQLHTLLNTPEHTPTSEQVEPLLQQLDSQYFPKEANHELRKQINQYRRQWQDYLAKQVDSEKQASLKQLSQTLDLCLAAENVVLAGQPVSVEMVLQWQENVAQIHHYFKNALQKRWQNLSTLANDETEQQLREEKAQDACLLLELLLAIDSPASEKAARIAKKMALFEQQSYPKTSQDAQVLIITTLNQILLIGGLNPERSQSLKQRLNAILMSAALSRML